MKDLDNFLKVFKRSAYFCEVEDRTFWYNTGFIVFNLNNIEQKSLKCEYILWVSKNGMVKNYKFGIFLDANSIYIIDRNKIDILCINNNFTGLGNLDNLEKNELMNILYLLRGYVYSNSLNFVLD